MPVCKNRFEKFASIFSKRHLQTTFSDAVCLGALRVKKLLYFCPTCLQRMIQMECYDIEVCLRAGKDIPVQDTITRKAVSDTCSSLSETLDVQINMVISNLLVSGRTLQEIKMQTEHE